MGTWISNKPTRSDLIHKRGDNASITFTHTFGAAGNVSEAKLTVREAIDGTLVFQLTKTANAAQWNFGTSNQGAVSILPANTSSDNDGEWFYDIELTHTDGTVRTFQEGRYDLSGDVS